MIGGCGTLRGCVSFCFEFPRFGSPSRPNPNLFPGYSDSRTFDGRISGPWARPTKSRREEIDWRPNSFCFCRGRINSTAFPGTIARLLQERIRSWAYVCNRREHIAPFDQNRLMMTCRVPAADAKASQVGSPLQFWCKHIITALLI